jgi:hypothetical protein
VGRTEQTGALSMLVALSWLPVPMPTLGHGLREPVAPGPAETSLFTETA